jgi:nicotinamidase-related amidase
MTMQIAKAKPYNFQYNPQQTALVLIDFQRDFLYTGGFGESLGNDVSLLQRAVEPTMEVLEASRNYGLPIFHVREGHKSDLSDCPSSKRERGNFEKKIGDVGPMGRILIRGEYGHGIIDELIPTSGEIVIDKSGKSAFYKTSLEDELNQKGIRYLIFTGVTTEVCTLTTVAQANDRGYEVLTLEDCVSSYKPELHDAALKMITSQNGIFGWTATSEKFLESLSI